MRKQILSLLVVLLIGSTVCMAQDRQKGKVDREKRIEQIITDLGLNEKRGSFRIQSAGKVIQRHLDDVLPDLFRIFNVIGKRLSIGDHDEVLGVIAGVLKLHPPPQRADVMPYMKPPGGAVASQNDLFHIPFLLNFSGLTAPGYFSGGDDP